MTISLSLREKLLYSCTSAGVNIIMTTVSTWLLYFWTPPPDSSRPQYLSVTLVGLLLTVGRFWDALIAPLIGHWSDVIHTPWGRRRPFLMFATPATVVTLVLLWTPPVSHSGYINASYFLLITIAFYTSIHLLGIPYDSSLPEMGNTSAQRVSLSMWKNIFGTGGVLIGAIVAAPLFSSFGPIWMSLVVGAIGFISVFLTLMVLREKPTPPSQTMTLRESLSITLQNSHFLRLCLSNLMVQTAYAMLLANLPYFVTLVIGKSEASVSLFEGVIVIAMMLAAPLWNWLSRRYPHRQLLMMVTLGLTVTIALNFTVGLVPGVNTSIYALVTLSCLAPFLGGYFILVYAMMGSVVDYDEFLTQHRREAFHYGAFSLSAGVGMSLSTLILPRIFALYGYTVAQPWGVRIVFLVAAVIVFLGAIALFGYRLGDTLEETQLNLGLKPRSKN